MIGVLMGDEHSEDIIDSMAGRGQSGLRPAHGDAGVDQELRIPA